MLGVDEAGRGPVIGDMFIAGVAVERDLLPILRTTGVKDSKKLTPARREKLVPSILSLAKIVVVKRYTPDQIDKYNINHLFSRAVVEITRIVLSAGFKVTELYVDAVGSKKTELVLKSTLPDYTKLIYLPKADATFHIVGAASIIAKFLRDEHVKNLHLKYGNFGSGYPSDPTTISWLSRYVREKGEIPPIVRKSWGTLKKLGIKRESKSKFGLLGWFGQHKD